MSEALVFAVLAIAAAMMRNGSVESLDAAVWTIFVVFCSVAAVALVVFS